ncbi:MAG TPA: DUF3194 domain-containing protein [Methanobacterium sp.]|nr:DUF3194 domain-containing protein [Methanobacterium sp.]
MRKLTDEELDQISDLAVETAENYIFSRVSRKEILDMDIQANISYDEELHVDLLVDIDLDELASVDENDLAESAAEKALEELDIFVDKNFR